MNARGYSGTAEAVYHFGAGGVDGFLGRAVPQSRGKPSQRRGKREYLTVDIPGSSAHEMQVGADVRLHRLADVAQHHQLTLLCYRRLVNERSEEHTSELQSRFDLVCRLL